ncbi:SAM-dependent methyltransferase [Clostridium omnivorum]|uniref:site-specific DNA-methyltransferase (adenine-specific) n=1 Tax=Clostridium omnivorum TaxID=1604902 RepID=A0ABQ5N7K6_9CLOT|nr:SAM-dependent methyltransferase [Clostridium sp. E14]GLC31162.1 hypothetical protein bsdE14_25720 [Clostridium sp. E14]
MKVSERDFIKNVRDYLLGRGCTITKEDVRQGSVIADMIGCIINEKGELENKVLVEIRRKPSPEAQKQLFSIAKKFNVTYSLLAILDDNNKPRYYWFETESGLPIVEQTFESISDHVISDVDIESTLWNALDLMRTMAITSDEAIDILLYLLLVRVYLSEHKDLDKWPSLKEGELQSLISISTDYYHLLKYDITRFMFKDSLDRLLSILNGLPVKSKHYHSILNSLIQKVMATKAGEVITPANLLNIIGKVTKELNIKDGKVINLGSGVGSLLREARENSSANVYEGIELNVNLISQSSIINILCGYSDITIKNDDAFRLGNTEEYNLTLINPPMGLKVKKDTLEGLDIAEGRGMVNITEAFIEKSINITIPGGYVICVVPEGILFAGTSKAIRDIILKKTIVKSIISLPASTFRPFTGVQTSLLILRKKDKSTNTPKDLFIGKIDSFDDTDDVLNGFSKWLIEEGDHGSIRKM